MFLRINILLYLIGFVSIYATAPIYKIERLSLEQGVSHNTVFSITQDSEKFLWFGTMFGLIRYDGKNYEKYRTDPFDYNTLSDDDVVTVYHASDGRIWVGTYGGGVNVFDKDSLKFKRYNQNNPELKDWSGIVWEITEDREGNIWLTTGNEGIIKISALDGAIESIKNTDSSKMLSSNYLRAVTKDSSGIWFGGYGGLTYLNFETNEYTIYSDENIGSAFVKDLSILTDDILLCATNNGLYSFTLTEAKFSKLVITDDLNFETIDINRILRTSKNQIWLGSQSGIYICDSNLKLIDQIKAGERSLYNNSVVSLHEDHSGIIWVGSYLGGVSKILKTDGRFSLIAHDLVKPKTLTKGRVKDFAIDSDKNIWVCTSEGITEFSNDLTLKNSYSIEKIREMWNLDLRFTSIEVDSQNNLYLGTNQGVVKVDDDFRLIEKFTRNRSGLSSDVVIKLLIDSNNNLWVGTVFGLSRINLGTGEITNWDPNSEKNIIVGQHVLSLYEDREGIIWLGTYRGLNRINPATNVTKFIGPGFNDKSKISNKYIFDFLEMDSTNVWIATGNGINIFNRETEKFNYLNRDDGLANAVIESFVNLGSKVYLSTNYGISIFDKTDGTVQNYFGEDGVGNNLFSPGASILTESNKILFGGFNGISVVDPVNVVLNEKLPENKLTSIKIFDEEIKPAEWDKKLELEYDQNSITINFASLEFTNPSKNLFAYRLEGVEKDWTYTDNSSVTFYHLPHGEYKFFVKSSNNEGIWNDQPAVVSFVIHPPFWKTYWFYSLLVIGLIGIAVFIHYKRLQSKLKVFLKIEEAKQRENESVRKRAAEDFHDELGHHLTRITLLIELLKRKFIGAESSKAEDIKRLGVMTKELSNKMRDFIWSLDVKNDTLYDLIIRLKDFGDDIFYDTSISFKLIGVNEELREIKLSLDWRRHLTLIFKEAMNNIVKYSKCENVELKIEKQNKYIKMELLDDGNGFDLLKIKKGNGLNNMKARAEYLKAKLDINSNLNDGTQIVLEGLIT